MVRRNKRLTALEVSSYLLALLVLLAACGSSRSAATGTSQTVRIDGSPARAKSGGTPAPEPTTVPMPATQTTCPAAGTARAAVFAPLASGSHQNVVYTFNQFPSSGGSMGEIKRYDAATGQKVIITSNPTSTIDYALISADGQWILFITQISGEAGLQLVRMDGQGLQTLYCAPNAGLIVLNDLRWSPDKKSVVFMDGIRDVELLDLSTADLQVELAQPSSPSAGGNLLFWPAAWLDDTHLYMTDAAFTSAGPAQPQSLYVLDTTKGAIQQISDLLKVFDFSDSCESFDNSVDRSRLFVATCNRGQGPSAIFSEPALGGLQTTVYSTPTLAIARVCIVSSTTMLLFSEDSTGGVNNGVVWKMNLDGTGLTHLAIHISSLNRLSQSPWSDVSRDGSMYALEGWSGTAGTTFLLLIGSMAGTTGSSVFATISGPENANIVGWTTM